LNRDKLYRILLDAFGEEFETRRGQFRINCINPDCDDSSGNLEISLDKGVFHCWKCHYKGNIRKLLKDYLGWTPNLDEYVTPDDLKNLGKELAEEDKVEKVAGFKGLPEEYVFLGKVEELGYVGKKALDYALSRIQMEDVIKYRIGYCGLGRYKWRLIIPSFECGKINYFVSRAFMPGVEPKYYNPTKEECGVGKETVVFNIDRIKKGDLAVICEGVFDAIKVGEQGVAILGTSISNIQLQKLVKITKNICVLLDQDATASAVKMAHRLKPHQVKVRIAVPPKGDPGDWPTETIQEWIRNSNLFTWIDPEKLEVF
jgi:DNA primase